MVKKKRQQEIRQLAKLKARYIRSTRTAKWTIQKKQRRELYRLAEKYPNIARLPLAELDTIAKEVQC